MSTTDVLVVGAGPVGMAMANELAMQGVSFRLVDKASARSDKSRAIGVHTRTMEVLSRYGDHVDELLAKAHKMRGNALWVNRKQYVLLDQDQGQGQDEQQAAAAAPGDEVPESRFPGPFVISQVDTEAFLERRLAERGVAVEYTVGAKSIAQDEEGVTVVLTKGDGSEETVRCKYVVRREDLISARPHSGEVVPNALT